MNPVFFILGPTCSGKTDLSFYLSSKMDSFMINADSVQMYKGLDIGSSKPVVLKNNFSIKGRQVQVAEKSIRNFYLLDFISPPEVYTAGQYEKEARSLLKKYLPHQTALVVGGSGFYLQALEKGCYPIAKMNPEAKKKLLKKEKELGLSYLYQRLKEKDPECAVHPHDRYRIFRALSVMEIDGLKMSEVEKKFRKKKLPYPIIKIGLTGSSSVLRKRVELRTKNMLARGFVEEVRALKKKGLEKFPALQSVGYKEILLCLEGEITEDELYEKIIQRTMQLIKKQKIWFKRDSSIRWYDCEADYSEIFQDIKNCL